MITKKETYIGDKNTFAIRYVPGYTHQDNGNCFAFCNLVLGGQLIGDPDESCFLSSWKHSMKRILERIKNDFESIFHPSFINKYDRELLELILKSNQLDNEYKDEFKYLPALSNNVWNNCHISLGETTDAYFINMINSGGQIKFLWEGYNLPCPLDKIGKVFAVTVDRFFVINVIQNCLDTIESEYQLYPIH